MIEISTRYVVVEPLKRKTAALVAEAFLKRYVAFCGIPSIIHSDASTEFKNNLVKELCQALDINHTSIRQIIQKELLNS